MGITFVGGAGGTTSATVPTHAIGDLILAFASRDGSTTAPSLPAGFTSIGTKSGTTCSSRTGFKIATATNDTSGTWTNATETIVQVYSVANAGATVRVGASTSSSGTTNTLSYGGLTLNNTDGTSWVAGFVGHRSIDTNIEVPPTGMTNRVDQLDATAESAGHDTNGGVASWSITTEGITGTASGWTIWVVELQYTPPPPTAGAWDSVNGAAANYVFTSAFTVANNSAGSGGGDIIKGLDNLTSTSGLRIAEIKFTGTGLGSGNVQFGICDGTQTSPIFSSAVINDLGTISGHAGGGTPNVGATLASGDSVLIAIDETNQLFWFGIFSSGGSWSGWNNSGGGDPTNPSTGGGLTTNTLWPAQLAIFVKSALTNDNVFTYRVTSASFSSGLNYPQPAGYVAWYIPPPPPPIGDIIQRLQGVKRAALW